MADEQTPPSNDKSPAEGGATAAPVKAKPGRKPKGAPPKQLPPWKVLLHNDDVNDMTHVVLSIMELTPIDEKAAVKHAHEAHKRGLTLLLVTHKERAELYQEQFESKGLTVTIEPAEKA